MKKSFIEQLKERVLLCDGATGTFFQSENLNLEKDYLGYENCSEILNKTRPDIIKKVHQAYLEVGVDCIETNSFGANKIVLADYGIQEKVYELNLMAAKLARESADKFSTDSHPRYVLGSMGPGTKLPSLGQITYDELVNSYAEQARGLLDGKIDCFLLETHQDLLTIKTAIQGCRIAKAERDDVTTPIFAQVTLETNGTVLTGSDINTVLTTLSAMDVNGIGLNCSTGPVEMNETIEYFSQHWPNFISVMPNAGLPLLVNGKTEYLLSPEELAKWQLRFVEKQGVNLIGGCCGTTPQHIAALRKMLDQRESKNPVNRIIHFEPAVSSLFHSVNLKQENALLAIGERTNANGSKQFRTLLENENFDGMLNVGRTLIKEGSHVLDICTALTGRSEIQDMTTLLDLCRTQLAAPIMIDSTDINVIEAGLKLLSGKSLINSINLEEGESKAIEILKLAKQFGAAVVALTIDEEGMAKTVNKKIEIAKRLYDLAVNQCHLPAHDLIFDPLTFTICTGTDDNREHGINTLEAIEQISKLFSDCQISLGLSNISFGLNPPARQVLNSVFLEQAKQHGLTAAIIHTAKILPLHKISDKQIQAAENLIFNRWDNHQDPLLYYMNLFSNCSIIEKKPIENLTIEELLKNQIIDGNKENLIQNLKKALEKYSPQEIINTLLLPGMNVVGDLFGCGKTQLPFVLQSAETMKAAIDFLKPFLQNKQMKTKGTIVLATVKGDVHDIGKNLVNIILSNNGYQVIDIGIKQSLTEILDAAKKYQADAIGMSGLLVKSTLIMKENLESMQQQNIHIPVILGGAALTKQFVENDCQNAYGKQNSVRYAKDAFSALQLMDEILQGNSLT